MCMQPVIDHTILKTNNVPLILAWRKAIDIPPADVHQVYVKQEGKPYLVPPRVIPGSLCLKSINVAVKFMIQAVSSYMSAGATTSGVAPSGFSVTESWLKHHGLRSDVLSNFKVSRKRTKGLLFPDYWYELIKWGLCQLHHTNVARCLLEMASLLYKST